MMWETVMGLEVHAQLKTRTKLFSAAPIDFGAPANTQTTFLDAGLPGTLPVVNQQAINMAIQFGLAINAEINDGCYFERKNYFYPDLPKGYQISQLQRPIVSHGYLDIEVDNGLKRINIERAHLEEDAGKSLHEYRPGRTGIDLNRAGTALLEIVTTPCFSNAAEVVSYLKTLHQLLRFLGICDGNMQEGSFRCDVNISIKPAGQKTLGTRTELKNINSFRFIEKAIRVEEIRQQNLLEQGLIVNQETRAFCPDSQTTHVLRSKENAQDYRYFPDPDLLPIVIDKELLRVLKEALPPLPAQIKNELAASNLPTDDIHFLLSHPDIYHFFAAVHKNFSDSKTIVNWLSGSLAAKVNSSNFSFEKLPISAAVFAEFLTAIKAENLSTNNAKILFDKLWLGENDIHSLITNARAKHLDADNLTNLIKEIIDKFPEQLKEYQQGKEKLLAFFVGQIMKESKGKADPGEVSLLCKKIIANLN